MFKPTITKNGNIRYLEIIKYVVLLSFFYAIITDLLDQYSPTLSTMNLFLTGIITIAIFIQLLFLNLLLYSEISQKLNIVIITFVSFVYIMNHHIKKPVYSTSSVYKPISIRKLNVIRC